MDNLSSGSTKHNTSLSPNPADPSSDWRLPRNKGKLVFKKKKSSESQLSRWFFPGLQEKQGVRWGQGGGRRDNTLPPGHRRLRSDKDGHRGLTSHPRISQRAITPCGGCLDQAADRSNRSCCSSQPSLGALFKAGDGRGQRRRGWRRSKGKVESETTVCQESTVGGSIE